MKRRKLSKTSKNRRFLLKISHREKAVRYYVYMTRFKLNFRFRIRNWIKEGKNKKYDRYYFRCNDNIM